MITEQVSPLPKFQLADDAFLRDESWRYMNSDDDDDVNAKSNGSDLHVVKDQVPSQLKTSESSSSTSKANGVHIGKVEPGIDSKHVGSVSKIDTKQSPGLPSEKSDGPRLHSAKNKTGPSQNSQV